MGEVLGPLLLSAAVVYALLCSLAVEDRGKSTPLWLRWPDVAWNAIKYLINRLVYGPDPQPVNKPDYTKIAILEYEEYGIEPEPGTAADVAIKLRKASQSTDQ